MTVHNEAQHDQVTSFCFADLTAEMGKWSVTDSFSEQNKTNQSRKMDCLEGSVKFHKEKSANNRQNGVKLWRDKECDAKNSSYVFRN